MKILYLSTNAVGKFIYGPGIDEPICMIVAAGANAGTYFYHADALGSVIALSQFETTCAVIVEGYVYDAFGGCTVVTSGGTDGNWLTQDDGTTDTTSQYGNPYQFTARRWDNETGLYYYRARMYNPAIGRFMQTDPIGYTDGMNMYAYCANNPVNWIDPSGLCKQTLNNLASLMYDLRYMMSPGLYLFDLTMSGIDKATDNGRYVGTGYGDRALDRYAYEIAFGDGNWLQKTGWYTGAFFAALWTPESYKETAVTLGTAWLGAKVAKTSNPLENTTYHSKVINQMSKTDDLYHAFPSQIDDFARMADLSKIKGGDGVVRKIVRIPGSINGKEGFFEYIIEVNKVVKHRLFKPI